MISRLGKYAETTLEEELGHKTFAIQENDTHYQESIFLAMEIVDTYETETGNDSDIEADEDFGAD